MTNENNVLSAVKAAKIDSPELISYALKELMLFYLSANPDHSREFAIVSRFIRELSNLGKERAPDWSRRYANRISEVKVHATAIAGAAAYALDKFCGERDSYERAQNILKSVGVTTEASFQNWVDNNRKTNELAKNAFDFQLAQLSNDESPYRPEGMPTLSVNEIKQRCEAIFAAVKDGFWSAYYFE